MPEQQTTPYRSKFITGELYNLHIIKFADESEIEADASISMSNDELWIWTRNPMEISEAATLFGNENKTSVIVYMQSSEHSTVFNGYTRMTVLQMNPNGTVSVRLNKPV